MKLAEILEADAVESENPQGVELFSPTSGLTDYDLQRGRIVLTQDYKVSRREGSDAFIFKTANPENGVRTGVHKRKLVLIRDLSNNKVIYSTTA